MTTLWYWADANHINQNNTPFTCTPPASFSERDLEVKELTMGISMKVEAMAGDDIYSSFLNAIRVAGILGINVEFDFNGVCCCAHNNGSAEIGMENYNKALASKDKKYLIAFDR